MSTTNLVSVDTSTSNSGYSLFQNGCLKMHGHIISKEKGCAEMCRLLIQLFDKLQPHIIVIETPSVVRNAKTQRLLTIVYGVVYGYCLTHEIEFHEMRPTEWRKYVGEEYAEDKHRTSWKQWAIDTANNIFSKESFEDDNEAESALIGYAYINWFNKYAKPL